MTPETHHFADDGAIPNSPLPVLVYHGVADCEALFAQHGWGGSWRSGIFDFHHFHSTAHEVLGILRAAPPCCSAVPRASTSRSARATCSSFRPAPATAESDSSPDLLVAGAYPRGQHWDLRRGDPAEHDEVLANIAAVALPDTEPVLGAGGPLIALWA